MITVASGPIYNVTADDPQEIAESLDVAEQLAKEWALTEGVRGILVTRHGPTSFTVALSADVPFGTTLEREIG